ncbi:hypothetical protein B484DRAFT_453487 [Ochromonadaceae sp. CCMP2298]|nr:hypothetical protein B484DRAFT_453487 [Ochromonadaceae sp. CCMP2298]
MSLDSLSMSGAYRVSRSFAYRNDYSWARGRFGGAMQAVETVEASAIRSGATFAHRLSMLFAHDSSPLFLRVKPILAIVCAAYQPPTIALISAALEVSAVEVAHIIYTDLPELLGFTSQERKSVVIARTPYQLLCRWLIAESVPRVGGVFWIDAAQGHNRLCALYLKYCGNKSVAVDQPFKDYLQTYGPAHLRRCSRGLRALTQQIRKIDETAQIRRHLPRQMGYIVGLYEIYARRVGLRGRIPAELGQLKYLRVLSMGNNHLTGELPETLGNLRNLQRIVLHQNNLRGPVPPALGELGCIVNLAGNPLLHHGEDVPAGERKALVELFQATQGGGWLTKTNWCTAEPVAKWYKVGVLSSHVHSIVMSTNGMEGRIPSSVSKLTSLRMIELATMPGLVGSLPRALCGLSTLRRLCICRCGLTGRIPSEIGSLVGLEELQLFGNQLSGSIPSSLSKLTNLKLLSLGEYTGGNNFQAEALPPCLASLVNLEALFMANCNVRGAIPPWLGHLSELRQLDLQRNDLSGSLPPCVGDLSNLLYLNVKENAQLGGVLPLEQLMRLGKLNRLSLVQCQFQDTEHAVDVLKAHLPKCKVWI